MSQIQELARLFNRTQCNFGFVAYLFAIDMQTIQETADYRPRIVTTGVSRCAKAS